MAPNEGASGQPSYEHAEQLYRRGDVRGARAELRRLLDAGERAPRVHLALGIASAELGELAEAETAFRDVLAAEPRHEQALLRLGRLLESSGRQGDAAPLYARIADGSNEARERLAALRAGAPQAPPQRQAPSPQQSSAHQVAFSPAEVGVVQNLARRVEGDSTQPLIPAFLRPQVQIVTFDLHRDDGSTIGVELRGRTLAGSPPRQGERVAIPAQRDAHGAYRVDRLQRLATGEVSVMERHGRLARAHTYAAYGAAALVATVLVVVALLVTLVVVPTIRDNEREQQRFCERHFDPEDC